MCLDDINDRVSFEHKFCSNFFCCNMRLSGMHELLEHVEEVHIMSPLAPFIPAGSVARTQPHRDPANLNQSQPHPAPAYNVVCAYPEPSTPPPSLSCLLESEYDRSYSIYPDSQPNSPLMDDFPGMHGLMDHSVVGYGAHFQYVDYDHQCHGMDNISASSLSQTTYDLGYGSCDQIHYDLVQQDVHASAKDSTIHTITASTSTSSGLIVQDEDGFQSHTSTNPNPNPRGSPEGEEKTPNFEDVSQVSSTASCSTLLPVPGPVYNSNLTSSSGLQFDELYSSDVSYSTSTSVSSSAASSSQKRQQNHAHGSSKYMPVHVTSTKTKTRLNDYGGTSGGAGPARRQKTTKAARKIPTAAASASRSAFITSGTISVYGYSQTESGGASSRTVKTTASGSVRLSGGAKALRRAEGLVENTSRRSGKLSRKDKKYRCPVS
ncbi:hypothetical protein K435DRAFT_507248 [Dendrothele bispora CBS 962.96]|uniref:Uncharacterized protein n=1 Tax=Dendrothele bispora (strain CBS 962.96) TaxID=1314807 RepID=A0A4S8MT74_DENBC|nr:hypothetical protein K435DRAFT_507248 [Dendrothele bispora CBS 962.96]